MYFCFFYRFLTFLQLKYFRVNSTIEFFTDRLCYSVTSGGMRIHLYVGKHSSQMSRFVECPAADVLYSTYISFFTGLHRG